LEQCPFCPPRLDDGQVTLGNGECLFLQQPQAVLVGSGLIIPRAHRETVFDLTDVEWASTLSLLKKVQKLLDAQYHPQGYNVGWNCGSVGGQEVFHAHLHVIPRFADEPYAGKGIRYWLKQPENQRPKSSKP
jgi:diadenosine tetraphosphate (Ap4A) HIT family hydrolase